MAMDQAEATRVLNDYLERLDRMQKEGPLRFKELFEKSLGARTLPVEVSSVRMASDPLTATARGALIAALYEK